MCVWITPMCCVVTEAESVIVKVADPPASRHVDGTFSHVAAGSGECSSDDC